MATKTLFISHDAQPHGAQIMLLHLVRWLAKNSGIVPHVLLKRDGPLHKEFAAAARTVVWQPGDSAGLLNQCRRDGIQLIYSNTITNGEVLAGLAELDCPVLTHVHELGYWITYRSGPVNNAQVVQHTDYFVAASNAVARCLQDTMHLPSERVFVVHELAPPPPAGFNQSAARSRVRTELGIPSGSFVIGGSGTTDWRKSPDLFVQLARAVAARAKKDEIHFVWVGGDNCGPEFGALWHDVCRVGLEKRIHFLGHLEKPADYFAAFDLFALTSREDPYPLVMLEAAAQGIPILGFDKSGGAPEFIEEDCGFIVPYLDVPGMADRALELVADRNLLRRLGGQARIKVHERHELEPTAQRIANLIEWTKLNHRLPQHLQRRAA